LLVLDRRNIVKVSEVASLVGVTPDTVRYYARIGLLVPAIDA
jgi:DNA-binding transcriptional MerR regulator